MVTTEEETPGRATVTQRWLARLALVSAAAAVLVPPVAAGLRQSLTLVLVGLVGLALTLAGVWWALTNKGLVRGLAVALAVAAPITVLVLYRSARLLWVVLVALGLVALAVAAGRAALRRDAIPERMHEHDVPPPRRPFLIMNPRSGGGKVARFGLKDKAEALGATVALLEGPGTVDVGELARRAVADGADLLGVAGGDGTQALVAGIAAEHDIPLLVISAGTRNHFALDLGLDREDPSRCLDALRDGVELRVDLGFIGERPFVNNASFGAYAAVVQSPAYRDDKARTTTDMLPELLVGQRGPRLVARAANVTVDGPQAVLVSNNVYGMGDIAGLGRRARLDRGVLGMFAVTVTSAVQAAGLLRGTNSRGLVRLAAPEVVVEADAAQIPVGVDGEALLLGHAGALHGPAGRPAGSGSPRPSRGAGSQTHHGLEAAAADGPDRTRHGRHRHKPELSRMAVATPRPPPRWDRAAQVPSSACSRPDRIASANAW
jgi:diacylglycerol kinase family enzyme